MRARGFTLIELLVTIAVITLLAALLIPGLLRVKASARSVQCKNNLRQIALATQSYVGDFSEYPLYGLLFVESRWHADIAPYLARGPASTKSWFGPLYKCPDNATHDHILRTYGSSFVGSYGYNYTGTAHAGSYGFAEVISGTQRGLGGWRNYQETRPCREADVLAPSEMILLRDGIHGWSEETVLTVEDWFSYGRKKWLQVYMPAAIRKRANQNAGKRHSGRYNVAFCDGHIEFIDGKTLFSSGEASRRWNTDNKPH